MRKQQACYDAKNSTIKKDIVLGKDYNNNLLVTNHAINYKKHMKVMIIIIKNKM